MKQVLIIRQDLKMGKGKIAGQCSHGAIKSYLLTDKDKRELWDNEYDYTKIVCKVKSLPELLHYQDECIKRNIPHFLVKDKGRTQIPEDTITCLAIGPEYNSILDEFTSDLKLL